MTSIPHEVTAVAGCNCGGSTMHRQDCSIWQLPDEQRITAVDDAEARVKGYIDKLNAGLRAGTGNGALAQIEAYRQDADQRQADERIRMGVVADLMRDGSTLFGKPVKLVFPEGLPGSMTEADALKIIERAAGR